MPLAMGLTDDANIKFVTSSSQLNSSPQVFCSFMLFYQFCTFLWEVTSLTRKKKNFCTLYMYLEWDLYCNMYNLFLERFGSADCVHIDR